MFAKDIERAIEEIRAIRVREWKEKYCREHELYKDTLYTRELDLTLAPEPTDADIGFPLETFAVCWETGYLVIELSALENMPAKQRNAIYKLGGLH